MRNLYTIFLASLATMVALEAHASTNLTLSFATLHTVGVGVMFMPPGPNSMLGFPVDLNGSYRSASSGTAGPSPSVNGVAFAATAPLPGGFGSILEQNGTNSVADNTINGTFTPFNDATKTPNSLTLATANDANGTKLEADVELGGTWKSFVLGGNTPPFTTGDTFTVGWINTFNSIGVQIITDGSGNYRARIASTKLATGALGLLETSGTPVTFAAGTTRVRIQAQVIGGLLTASVMPLDGPGVFTVSPLGSTNGLNLDTAAPWSLDYTNVAFLAGFETREHTTAAASAIVSNYSTDAIENALFLVADDPYVRTADGVIEYRGGQANLIQPVTGFQAFMNAAAGQTFASAAYAGPYAENFPNVITSALDAAEYDRLSNQVNATVLHMFFTPGASDAETHMGFRPNAGTSVNLFAGADPLFLDINAATGNSNQVLIDNTAPTLGVPTLGGTGYDAPNAIVGDLEITSTALDGGTQPSGLDNRPSGAITWSDASTTPVRMVSVTGNTFRATVPITGATPNGSATLVLSVSDRAGNTANRTLTFNVSTVKVALTITQTSVTANVNRVIKIKLGSTGGSHAPITVRKVVAFTASVGSTIITYQDLDLADDGLANNSVSAVAGITQAYVKDPFFSLAKQIPLGGTPGNLTGSANLQMGDLTDNNIVNVSDLAVWAANNGTTTSPDTTLNQPATPRQANVDGLGSVNLQDRNLIIASWLFAGDGDGVNGYRGDGSQTVAEVVKETGLPLKLVASMDADKDGRVTLAEVLRWRRGSIK